MEIKLHEITVKELTEGYVNEDEKGVKGYGGKLDIRPPYQRNFIYKDPQRDEVIRTVQKEFPLNVMYWCHNDDGSFEVMDGQQRTISLCEYVKGNFSLDERYFHNLEKSEQEQILNYKLSIYICTGDDKEKLDWFKTINIAGERLTDQELRNAIYHGPWVTNAKAYFSKVNGPASAEGSDYLTGSANRQEYLETAIKWISDGKIEQYMAEHQHDKNATLLWGYFQRVIAWVKTTFPNYRNQMKGVDWGSLYAKYKDKSFDTDELEDQIKGLMMDDEVTNKKGIYTYVLTGEEKTLSIRAFTDTQKREAYERQDGNCAKCGKHFELSEMEADHITPWSQGGKTTADNCQMLCKHDNRTKSDI